MSLKEALSVLMLCTPVFIFISGSSALLGRPHCGLSIWLLLLAIFNNFLTRKQTKHDNTCTWSPTFSYDTKMTAYGFLACKALILRASLNVLSLISDFRLKSNKVQRRSLLQWWFTQVARGSCGLCFPSLPLATQMIDTQGITKHTAHLTLPLKMSPNPTFSIHCEP